MDPDWAKEFVRGMIGKGMGGTDSFRLIPLTLLYSAAQCAHLMILAQRAEFVQAMVGVFFITRNPCKYWSKRVPGGFLSSMYS